MAEPEIKSTSTGMSNLLLVASICTILMASLELIGWVFEWQMYAAAIFSSIPMAPSTAICFILLALIGLFEPRKTSGKAHVIVSMSVIILVMVFCGLDLLESLSATSLDIEGHLLPESGFLNKFPLGRMSPMTATLFLLSAGAMLLIVIRSMPGQEHRLFGHLSGLLGCVVAFSGFTLVLGYLYGTPLLYNSGFIPVAATTALCFVFLGLAVFARLKSDDIPKRYFLGSAVHRQLSQAFVPLVFFAVILQGILWRFAPLFVDINNALLSALLAGIVAVLAVIVTSKVISLVGGAIVRAGEALQESEERRRLAQDAANAGTWEWDLRTNENFWSDELWTLYGLEPYSCEPSYEAWLRTIHPDDRAVAERAIQEAASKGTELTAVWRTQSPNGHERWLMSRGRPICDENGRVMRYIGIVIDITESKKAEDALRASEERYRAVFDNAGIGIDLLDQDGRILQVNQSLLDMLGYSEKELHQLTFLDITHPEEREISKRNLEALMAGEIEFYRLEKRYLRKDGSILWADLTTSAVRGPNGEHLGTIGVISDTTDRKKAEQEREQLRNQLAQAQKMEAIGTLTGGIAHDFNNLLTVILGYSEMLLLERDEKDPAYDDLQKIMQSARNGAEMVQRLLLFSRKAEMNPVPLDMNRQVRNTERLLSRTLPKAIRIEMRLADDLKPVYADPSQMDQIVMNLAINAKEAMPDGGILSLETSNVALESEFCARHPGVAPGDYVLLSVSDTGRGMDSTTVERLFDPFFTTKGWDSRKGTGLGLPVVYGIVATHGGCIESSSEVGKGTTFSIFLPTLWADHTPKPSGARELQVRGTETILLVDDEGLVRDLGERILTKSGYKVLTARNGREALDIYKQHRPEIALVILDLIMPEMSGKECLRELVKIDPKVRVIVSSGHADSEDPHEVPHEFVRASVKKPYGVGQLLETVRSALDA